MLDAGLMEMTMNEFYVEFDDLEGNIELWLDRVANDGVVVVITAESVPQAAIVPYPLFERLEEAK